MTKNPKMQFGSFFCEKYKCKMTEFSCKRYQIQEYGQACSGCEQMQVPKINFVQDDGKQFHYVKLCVYCGTEDRTKFKKGFNRICEECRKGGNPAIRPFNPSVKVRSRIGKANHDSSQDLKIERVE